MGYDVFISYAHEDKAIAKRITEALDANGIHYFIDWNNINGGEQYIEAIALALRNSSIVLFIGSQSAYESPYVYREIKFAQEKNPGHIIPLLIDNSPMPDRYEFILGDANFRYLEKTPIETTLMDDIKRNLGRKKQEVRSDCMLHRQSIIVTIAEILQVIFYLTCFGYITGLFAEGSFMYKHPTYTVSLITIILETLLLASAGFTIGLMNKSKVSFFVICALDIIELVLILVICSELYKRHANIKVINNVYRDALMYGKLAKDSFQLISTSILIPIHIIGMRAVLMLKKNGRSAWKQLQ